MPPEKERKPREQRPLRPTRSPNPEEQKPLKEARDPFSEQVLPPFLEPERDALYRRMVPVETATPGRSIKLRDLFTLGGTLVADATGVTVTASVVSTTETDLKSFRFFKDEFYRGMLIKITAFGTYTSDGTRTVTLKIGNGLAPTTEWNSAVSTAASTTDAPWHIEWYGIIGTIGASGTVEAQMRSKINNVNKDDANNATIALNTRQTNNFALTATWSANNSGNAITVRQWIVEVLR